MIEKLTDGSRQVESAVDPTVHRDLATRFVDPLLLGLVLGLVVERHLDGLQREKSI